MKVEFDYGKLKGRIVEIFGNQGNFAKARGQSQRTISLKLNNKVPFTDREICDWCTLLNIPDNKVDAYFFTRKVQKIEQITNVIPLQ